ncbi:MAG: hypothetical protein E6Q06_01735 [Candidatus Moraniibacteriota bacterium]|nr:MAG: hypothetical protein E6Q06_01735 [Candidatus Moranbacteria bacterium]
METNSSSVSRGNFLLLQPFNSFNILGVCSNCDEVVRISNESHAACKHEAPTPLEKHQGHAIAVYLECFDGHAIKPDSDINKGGYVHTPDGRLIWCPPRKTFCATRDTDNLSFWDVFEAVGERPEGDMYMASWLNGDSLGLDFMDELGDRVWCNYCQAFLTRDQLERFWPGKDEMLEFEVLTRLHYDLEHGGLKCSVCGVCGGAGDDCQCVGDGLDSAALCEMWRNMGKCIEKEPRHIRWMANSIVKEHGVPDRAKGRKYLAIFNKLWKKRPRDWENKDYCFRQKREIEKIIAESLVCGLTVLYK